jgi:hypothetical protein
MDQIHLSPLVDQIQLALGHISNTLLLCSRVVVGGTSQVAAAEPPLAPSLTSLSLSPPVVAPSQRLRPSSPRRPAPNRPIPSRPPFANSPWSDVSHRHHPPDRPEAPNRGYMKTKLVKRTRNPPAKRRALVNLYDFFS